MKNEQILGQDRRLKFPHIYAIEASAGAGKTHSLTLRYIQFILSPFIQGGHFRYISAITFTNRAANEMKTRILRMLKELALGQEDRVREVAELVALEREKLIKESGKIVDEMIKNFSELKIGTIDSFINSIIRSSVIEVRVSPDFEIITDPDPFIEYAVDSLLEKIVESNEIREIIDKFIKSFLEIEKKEGWNPKNLLLSKISFFRRKQNEGGFTFSIPSETYVDIKKIVSTLKNFLEVSRRYGLEFDSRAERGILKFLDPDSEKISEYFAKNAFELFKKSGQIPEEVNDLWGELKRGIGEYYESEVFSKYRPYILILKEIEKELAEIKTEKGILFIDELNVYVKELIDKYKVPYVYYKLGEEIAHYMIDEFQDTNEIQWENIKELVENSLSKGGSLFYVGDKKQAIYRFRGGKAELFDEVMSSKELTHITNEVYTKRLSLNRRSRAEIIRFINSLFSIDNILKIKPDFKLQSTIKENQEMLMATYKNSAQLLSDDLDKSKSGGYVYLIPLNDPVTKDMNKDEYSEIIKNIFLNKIKEVISRGNNSDIAVLVPTGNEVKTITEWLIAEEIQTVSESAGDIREHPLIKELFSFLKFLNDKSDNLAFASFISGDVFTAHTGLGRDDIYKWFNQVDIRHTILYKRFQEWEQGKTFWERDIEYFCEKADLFPVYDIVCELFDRFMVFSRFKGASGFLIHFLEVIRLLEEEGGNNIDFIIQEWEKNGGRKEIFVAPLNLSSAGVKVMTLHKAKGLEFSVVFLPFAGISGEKERDLILKETREIVAVDEQALKLRPDLYEKFEKEFAKSIIDQLNVLYVGCTRAKDELYIIVPPKVKRSKNLLLEIPPFTDGEKEYGKKIPFFPSTNTATSREINIFDQHPPNKLRDSFREWSDRFCGLKNKDDLINSIFIEEEEAIKKGNLVHQVLSKIIYPEDLEKIDKIESLFLNVEEVLKESVLDSIKKLFNNPEVIKLFFPPEGGRVLTEAELVTKSGEIKRVDRMIIEDHRVTVIDFKTGQSTKSTSDKSQIREYKKLVQKVFPDKEVRAMLVYCEPFEMMEI